MIKILHSADWHLDAPLTGHSQEDASFLRREMKKLPERIVKLAKAEHCRLILLAGDLFDGTAGADTVLAVQQALAKAAMPVFISPGNHDFLSPDSPYNADGWPENVHIFKSPQIESIPLPQLDCRVYGAGYQSMDCPGLLNNFQAAGSETWQLGILHGEADTSRSDYCPITKEQIRSSGFHYLALGHIHKGGSIRAGETLCAWPGCPMGHGYDELGTKGVIVVSLDQEVTASFIGLDTPRFYDEELEVGADPKVDLSTLLPALHTDDFYRITLTGYSAGLDLQQLRDQFPHVPHLILRDETRPEMDLWSAVGDDSLEGVFFGLLQQGSQSDNESVAQRARLAARICRQILDKQEVKLP